MGKLAETQKQKRLVQTPSSGQNGGKAQDLSSLQKQVKITDKMYGFSPHWTWGNKEEGSLRDV